VERSHPSGRVQYVNTATNETSWVLPKPPPPPQPTAAQMAQMLALGFSEAQASHFLRQCQGNMERAIDAILANPDWQPPPQQQGRDDGDRTGVAAAADVTSSHSTYSSSHANQGLPGAGEGGGAVPLESAHASLREAHETSLAENAALRADNASLQGELTMLRDALSHALRGDPVLAHALAASPARCLSTLAAAAVATAAASPPCAPEPAPEPEPARPAAAPSLPPGSAQLEWTFGAAAPDGGVDGGGGGARFLAKVAQATKPLRWSGGDAEPLVRELYALHRAGGDDSRRCVLLRRKDRRALTPGGSDVELQLGSAKAAAAWIQASVLHGPALLRARGPCEEGEPPAPARAPARAIMTPAAAPPEAPAAVAGGCGTVEEQFALWLEPPPRQQLQLAPAGRGGLSSGTAQRQRRLAHVTVGEFTEQGEGLLNPVALFALWSVVSPPQRVVPWLLVYSMALHGAAASSMLRVRGQLPNGAPCLQMTSVCQRPDPYPASFTHRLVAALHGRGVHPAGGQDDVRRDFRGLRHHAVA
jgi:hypothetical protein